MGEISETKLPGIGIRFDYRVSSGARVGVLVHRTGRRDLLVYAPGDDDACRLTLSLDPDDARTVAELLGASRIAEQLTAVQQDIEGLAIDWVKIEPGSEWAGEQLGTAAVHTNTGVSVVALIGSETSVAAPGAEDLLTAGHTAVAIGTPEGIERFAARVRRA